jgi:hypothetical protein
MQSQNLELSHPLFKQYIICQHQQHNALPMKISLPSLSAVTYLFFNASEALAFGESVVIHKERNGSSNISHQKSELID